MLLKTIWRYWNCFLSPVASDGMDGNGLKLEKIGQFFQVLMLRVTKIVQKIYYGEPALIKFIWYLPRSVTEAFCLWLKPKIDLKLQNPRDTAPLTEQHKMAFVVIAIST